MSTQDTVFFILVFGLCLFWIWLAFGSDSNKNGDKDL